MRMLMMTGTPSIPKSGAFGVPGPVWPEQAETKFAAATGTRISCLARGLVYHARLRTLDVNPIGIDLPVIDRMRVSATEP